MKSILLKSLCSLGAISLSIMSAHAVLVGPSVTITIPPVAIMVGSVTVDYNGGTNVTNLKYRTVDAVTCDATIIDPLLYTTGSSVSDNAVPGGGMYATTGSVVFNPSMSSNGHYVCIAITDNGNTSYRGSSTAINIIPMIMPPPPPMPIPGCTNPLATNYNPSATLDNGSCTLPVVVSTAGPGGGGGGGSSYTPMISTIPVVETPSTVVPTVTTPIVTHSSTEKSIRFVVRTTGADRSMSVSQIPDGTTLTLTRLVGNKKVVVTTVIVKDGKVTINQSQRGRYILTR